jgi:hypothetical protein
VVARRGRGKKVCARGVWFALLGGPSTSPLGGRVRYLLILTPLLASCAVITYDVTHDPIAAPISERCFALQLDAYVVNTGGIGTKDRLMIPEGVCRSADGALIPNRRCRLTAKALIPRGSTLTVLKVKNRAVGESGRCWAVTARLTPPSPFAGEIVVPSCGLDDLPQYWLDAPIPEWTKKPLEFKPDYLLPCRDS